MNPNLAEAHAFYAHNLMNQGRQDEAMAEMQRAVELDPLNNLIHALYAVVLEAGKRYDDAIQEADSVLHTDPNEAIALVILVNAYAEKGMLAKSLAATRSLGRANGDSAFVSALDRGYDRGGYKEAMLEAARTLTARSGQPNADPFDAALYYLHAGDTSAVFTSLEQAYQRHDPNMPYLGSMPVYDRIRPAPRFQDLLRKMGLPAG
jgi:tetratricopeptide (TPR) repeat protein